MQVERLVASIATERGTQTPGQAGARPFSPSRQIRTIRGFPSARRAANLHSMSRRVAVIDIGSNSIKSLVAEREGDGSVRTIATEIEETRISRGINNAGPVLSEAGITAGAAAVSRLVRMAARHGPAETAIVATSAVRDAGNRAAFQQKIFDETGLPVRILSGAEEAGLIGLGLALDSGLLDATDFFVFDLGGGSLECLEFRDRQVARAASLQLGCVRLTEQCVADAAAVFTADDRARVAAAVARGIRNGFPLTPEESGRVIATGGSVTTARAMLAAKAGLSFEARDPFLAADELETLLAETGRLALEQRRATGGLPAARADVITTALATLVELARLTGASGLLHSGSSLRLGVAARMLGL